MKIYEVAYGELNDYSTIAMFVNRKAALSLYDRLVRGRGDEPDIHNVDLPFTFYEVHVNDSVDNIHNVNGRPISIGE